MKRRYIPTASSFRARTNTDKNVELAFLHLESVIADPALLEEIPDNAHLVLLPEHDDALVQHNRELGARREREGHTVIYRPVRRRLVHR